MTPESIIRKMPVELSNKIAAGEVVQRPASVVKELIDNAIDAGAASVRILIQDAGKQLIQVTDDGCGMSPEDVRLCVEPHATSKIHHVDDLHRVRTLGFRGEAMASIASVSQLEIVSRRVEDTEATRIVLEGGAELDFAPAASEPGTRVSVRNLFFNVPARRRFLRTDTTELRYVMKVVQQMAIAHPEIAFELQSDGENIYRLPPQSSQERVSALFGAAYKASLIPVGESTELVDVSGFLSDPKLSRKSRGEQFVFVNRRPVQHRVLQHQILSVYQPWTRQNEYPFFALFIEIAPDQVDVNVHPAKEEVKFSDERSVIRLIGSIVRKSLNAWLLVPELPIDEDRSIDPDVERFERAFRTAFNPGSKPDGGADVLGTGGPAGDSSDHSAGDPTADSAGNQLFSPSKAPYRPSAPFRGNVRDSIELLYGKTPLRERMEGGSPVGTSASEGAFSGVVAADAPSEINPADSAPAKTVETVASVSSATSRDVGFWQLHGQYILTQTRSGLCLVDQHLAHRRIIFEKAMSATEEALPGTQQLLFAHSIDLSATDFSLLKEILPIMLKMGFNIELMSGNTALVSGVPADIDVGDEKTVVGEMIQQVRDLDQKMKLEPRRKVAIAFANRSAIPRGKRLSTIEMEALMDQLFACAEPYSDPMGRPTLTIVRLEEIAARFSRPTSPRDKSRDEDI